jgi:hypothetical protein
MDPARSGVAFVSEEFDPDDAWRLTGRFSAHWEDPDRDGYVAGPRAVSLEEAIAWARRSAPVVLVRLGDDDEDYSAGDERPDEAIRPWPTRGMVVRPRPFGAALDGSEQVVTWSLESTVRSGDFPTDAIRTGLEAHAHVTIVTIRRSAPGSMTVRYAVSAEGSVEALQRGDEALTRVVEDLTHGAPDRDDAFVESTVILGRK